MAADQTDVKLFLERHILLIDDYNFTDLYRLADRQGVYIGDLTALLMSVDINPLPFLSKVPQFFLNGVDTVTSVVLPENITNIEHSAFEECNKLVNIEMTDSVTEIGSFAFANCYSLKNIRLSKNITSIGGWAFNECSNLEAIHIPEGVDAIQAGLCSICKSLKEVTIPSTVNNHTIESYAFQACKSLEKITYSGTIQQWEKIYNYQAFIDTPKVVVHCADGDIKLK